jgi:transcriptional regulatory protein RtcR
MLVSALETGRFRPVGSRSPQKELKSEFELICCSGKNLLDEVCIETFREDLLALIGFWTFKLPSLKERPEALLPTIQADLLEYGGGNHAACNITDEALKKYLAFAHSPEAKWRGNFRSLNQSVKRMCFFAQDGQITKAIVIDEIERLKTIWENEYYLSDFNPEKASDKGTVRASVDTDQEMQQEFSPALEKILDGCDEFDQVQLLAVIDACRKSETMASAGRKLFAKSRQKRASFNDSDRLKKYLERFGLSWEDVRPMELRG